MAHDDRLKSVLDRLTREEKHALARFGITPQIRSDWIHTKRKPTAAQLKTLAIVAGVDEVPLLQWLADAQASPEQLDLFLRALAKATAGLSATVLAVILSGAENHADAASMRAGELTSQFTGTHIMRS